MSVFVKATELKLTNGGYLTVDGKPVFNYEFVNVQERIAELALYIEVAEGETLKDTKATLDYGKLLDKVEALKVAKKTTTFVEAVKLPKQTLQTKLHKEAMEFMSAATENDKITALNSSLQEFQIIKDFEEFGLYFDESIVKLEKIYTLEETIEIVKKSMEILSQF
jgi:hypothetical protein